MPFSTFFVNLWTALRMYGSVCSRTLVEPPMRCSDNGLSFLICDVTRYKTNAGSTDSNFIGHSLDVNFWFGHIATVCKKEEQIVDLSIASQFSVPPSWP